MRRRGCPLNVKTVNSKRHPYKCMYECLSTIINMVLSVKVYYYNAKNITTFIIVFFKVFNGN